MKTTFLVGCALFFVCLGKPSQAEVSEGWIWQIGDDFEAVAALVPLSRKAHISCNHCL